MRQDKKLPLWAKFKTLDELDQARFAKLNKQFKSEYVKFLAGRWAPMHGKSRIKGRSIGMSNDWSGTRMNLDVSEYRYALHQPVDNHFDEDLFTI